MSRYLYISLFKCHYHKMLAFIQIIRVTIRATTQWESCHCSYLKMTFNRFSYFLHKWKDNGMEIFKAKFMDIQFLAYLLVYIDFMILWGLKNQKINLYQQISYKLIIHVT